MRGRIPSRKYSTVCIHCINMQWSDDNKSCPGGGERGVKLASTHSKINFFV